MQEQTGTCVCDCVCVCRAATTTSWFNQASSHMRPMSSRGLTTKFPLCLTCALSGRQPQLTDTQKLLTSMAAKPWFVRTRNLFKVSKWLDQHETTPKNSPITPHMFVRPDSNPAIQNQHLNCIIRVVPPNIWQRLKDSTMIPPASSRAFVAPLKTEWPFSKQKRQWTKMTWEWGHHESQRKFTREPDAAANAPLVMRRWRWVLLTGLSRPAGS